MALKNRKAKEPRIDPAISPDGIFKKCPVWRLGRVDFGGKWGFENIEKSVLKQMLDKLESFESMTWGEIEKKVDKGGQRQNHAILMEKVCKEARDRLKKLNLLDFGNLYQLRFSGEKRLWGIRDAEVMHVLWWDPYHTVYPIEKKHT